MRLKLMLFILPVMIFAGSLHAFAQGSLGDPIYTFDFGSGTSNVGPPLGLNPLGTNYTNMAYTTGCPGDGQYSIVHSLNNSNNCHEGVWQDLPTDYPGSTKGYFMLINASLSPNVFFAAPLPTTITLCQNTTYRFSAYICNLIEKSASAGEGNPDIVFTVNAPDGTQLGYSDTKAILPNDPSDSPWQYYYVNFSTMGYFTVTVTMTNNAAGGIGNDLALDDISFAAYGPAVSTPAASANSGPPSICLGDKYTYRFTSTPQPGIYANPRQIWQVNINGEGWNTIPGQQEQTLTIDHTFNPANTPGTYQYREGVAEGDNINSTDCRVYSDPVTINVNPLPEITGVEPTQSECSGDVLTLSATGGDSYIWTGPNMQPTTANPLIISGVTPANSGVYKVTAISTSGCQSYKSTKVTVFPKVHAKATGSTTVCAGTPTQISASGGVSYTWSPGGSLSDSTIASPIATPTDATVYHVTVTDINGCTDTASVTIKAVKQAIVNAGTNKIIFEGQSVELTASEQYTSKVYWTPVTGLSDPDILKPVASPSGDITYTLHGVSKYDCGEVTSSVFVRVFKKVTIPDTFSPNNDGLNDFWEINALATYPNSRLYVYDRYGQVVYKSIGIYKPWNGSYNGKPVPAGTYYYILDLENNTPKLSGYVMVLR